MTEIIAGIKLNEYLTENNISECKFISHIGHKDNESVYGSLFETEKGLLFVRTKYTEVNKTKSVPKVCGELQYSFKLVGEEIFNSFIMFDKIGYIKREAIDWTTEGRGIKAA